MRPVLYKRSYNCVTMSTSSDVSSRFEQYVVIRFLTIEKCLAVEIHKYSKSAYGNGKMSNQHVRRWCQMFEGGQTSITNNKRVGRLVSVDWCTDNERVGRPVSASTDDLLVKIDVVIQSNRNVRLSLIANIVNEPITQKLGILGL